MKFGSVKVPYIASYLIRTRSDSILGLFSIFKEASQVDQDVI